MTIEFWFTTDFASRPYYNDCSHVYTMGWLWFGLSFWVH